ncbi:MAG: primase C-terminal domain-containing protein [Lentisphaerae bacterium]|nr:primase C-terminal domain-containing protein [Lentisphaerota bacterium]
MLRDETLRATTALPLPDERQSSKVIPCIIRLFRGVANGKRNISAFRLSVFLKNQGLPLNIMLKTLAGWNEANLPPLNETELRRTAEQVYRRDYHGYGCADPQMREFCRPYDCPIHRARSRQCSGNIAATNPQEMATT